jgi:hypothetical protein
LLYEEAICIKVIVDEQVILWKGFYDSFLKTELLEKWVITDKEKSNG